MAGPAIKPGDRVQCPPDHGRPGYVGISPGGHVNIYGARYQWATVKQDGQGSAVWPTNRLTRI